MYWEKVRKKMCAVIVCAIMTLTMSGNVPVVQAEGNATTEAGAYGVGQGKQIPDHIFAPFVDVVSWTSDAEYASAGSLSLKKMYQDTGILYYNLGFITTDATNSTVTDGILNWCWGGYSTLSEKSTDTWQLDGIKESIRYIRSVGGDVIISIGGLNEGHFFQATQDEAVLYNTYMDIIRGYGLTRLDLDIEGSAQIKDINIPNAKALKRVQDETGVEIVLTLPVLPSGLTDLGMGVLEAYLENDVDIKMVNIMSMCYGSATLLPEENYGTASLRAVNSLASQLKSAYSNIQGVSLSDADIYSKIGTTVSIGYESDAHPVWTTEWSQLVVNQAKELNIGMTSFWCLNRDCMQYGENSGIYGMYEHTNIFKTFMQGDSEYVKPEDGTDGDNNTESDDGTENEGGNETGIDEWDEKEVYVQGNRVVYDGKIWEAQWWTQGTAPGTTESSGASVWKYIADVNVDGGSEEDGNTGNNGGNAGETDGSTKEEDGAEGGTGNDCDDNYTSSGSEKDETQGETDDEKQKEGGQKAQDEIRNDSVIQDDNNDRKTDSVLIGTKFASGRLRYVITSDTDDAMTVQVINPIKKTYSELTIPATVKYQGKKYKVTSIGKEAFKNNKKLKKVVIGKNVDTIKKKAFYNCRKMTSVTFGTNIQVVESKAFYKCQKLSKIIFKGTKLERVGSKAFIKTHSKLKIKVKNKKTISNYKKLLKKKVPSKTKITK